MSDLAAAPSSFRPVLDHAVINVMGMLDEAAEQYTRLGFQLTERGHHTLGSSNNLAIFGTTISSSSATCRDARRCAPICGRIPGLTGLVFKSVDAGLVYSTLQNHGVPVQEPMSFARPVALPGCAQDARFKVIRVAGDAVQNGRTFFCHHDTPELVYRPEWRMHPNGVTDIVEFVIASRDPASTAAVYNRMFGPNLVRPIKVACFSGRRRKGVGHGACSGCRALRRCRTRQRGRFRSHGRAHLQGGFAGHAAHAL